MASKDVIEQVSARAKQMSSGAKKGASQQVIDEVRARALKKTDIGNAVLRPNEGISTSAEAGEVPEGSTVRSSTGRIVSSQAPNLRTGNIGVEYSPKARQEQIRQRLEAKEAANQEKLKENLAKAASGQDGLPQDLKNPTEYMLERAKQERQQREEELRRTIEDLSGGSSIADFSRLKEAQEELQKLEQEDAKPEMEQLAELIGQQQRDAAKSRQAKSLDDNRQHNLEYLLASFAGGVSDWGNGVVQGIDALIPGDTTPANIQPFYHVKQDVEDTVENLGDTVSSGMQKYGGTIARGIGYSTPSAVLAMIPGVQSLSAAAGKGIEGMLKNPLYWASLIPTYGASYAEAKEDGATEEQAQLMAILNGFAGAAVEVGGGIEQIPTSKPGIRTWLKGMLEEGNEEVVQGIIEQLAKKITYDYDREWVSLTDPDAILNPNRAKDEFLGGAMVGGVLGGGQTMVNIMAQHAQYNRIGQELLQSENSLKNALVIGMANAEGTDARQAAEKIAGQLRSGKTPSAAMIGRLAVESSSEQALHAYRIHAKVMESADTTGASTEVAGAVAAVAVRFDRSVVFDAPESLQTVGEDGEAKQGAGYYDSRNDTIHVNAELTTDQAVDFVLKHELTHAIEGSETYTMLKQLVREQMGQEQFTAQVNETAEERRAAGDTVGAQSAEKEVIADWIGNNLFKDGFAARVTKNSRTLGEQFYRALWSVQRALAFTKNARQATRINKAEQAFVNVLQSDYRRGNSAVRAAMGRQYKINSGFAREYESWDKKSTGGYFTLGTTSKALESVGINPSKIYWDKSKVKDILNNPEHNMKDSITKVPELLENPILIMQSQTVLNRVVLLGEINDDNGYPVICALELKPNGEIQDYIKVASAYGKDGKNAVQNLINTSNILYIDPDKKRTDSWLEARRLQLPVGLTNYGPIGRVSLFQRNVNGQYEINEKTPKKFHKTTMQIAFEEAERRSTNTQSMQNGAKNAQNGQKSFLPVAIEQQEQAEKNENARRVANSAENEQDAENGQEDWEYSDEEMDRMVDEAAERRRTKLQEAQRDETERLTERLQAGEITAEEFGDEMERLRREAVEDNEKKWRRGNRGELQQKEQIRQERRAARADYVEKKAELEAEYADRKATDAEKRKAESEKKKKAEYRRQVSKIIDELNSLLEHPDKNRHIPAENVQAVREVLETLAEDPAGIRQEINEIKRQMAQTADQRKIDRLAKQLNAREKRLENVSDQLRRVQDMYKDQAGEDDLAPTQNAFFGKKIAMLRESLDGRSLDKLSSGEMREVVDIMRSVVSQIRSANQLHSKAMRENAIDTAERFVREMDEASAYGKLGEKIRNMMLWQLSPDRFFESLCGWKANSVGKEIADSMIEAETKELSIRQAFSEHFYAYANGENSRNYDALSNTKELVDIGLQDSKGNAMKMTRGMMMSLYMNLLCEGNRRAIIDGGLILPDIKRYYNGDMANAYENGQRMTPTALSAEIHDVLEKIGDAKSDAERQNLNEELETLMVRANHDMEAVKDRIEEQMTDYERNLVKQAKKWFNEKSKSYINEATREVWDYEAARVKDYYPIYRDKNYVTTGMDSLVQNLTVENTGSLKARVRSKAPVHITDISQVLSASCDTTARFAGWLAFTTDFHKLYNTTLPGGRTSVKETLARKWGKGKTAFGVTADQYIQNFMADISGSRKADASPLSIFRKNAVRATLTLNLRVAVSQAASLPTAAAEIGYKYVAKAMKHLPEINAETMEKMRKYSVYFWQRSRGDGGMEEIALANSGSNVIDKAWDKVDKKTKGYLLNWCQKMDVLTVATCWFACEEMIKETRTDLKPGTDAFDRAVGQQLNTVIRKTQPNFTVAERSDLLRSKNEALKFLTMYKTQANQNMNILYEATGRYRATLQAFKAGTATQDELDAARRRLVNGYTGVIAGGTILFVLLRTLVNVLQHRMNGYRDKDGEITAASMAGAFGQEVLSSMAGMFAFGDIIYDALSARVFGGNYYGLSDTALETVGSLLEDFATGDLSKGKTWNYIMRDLMNAMGIPYKNVVDMVMGFSYHIEDIQNGEFLSMNAGYKTSDAMFYRRLYRYTKKGDTEKAAHLRQYLLTTGKTEEQIDAGMRTAIKGEDEDYRKQNDRMFKEVCSRALFSRLTDAEKKKVENGISGYVADALMAEKTGGTMKAEHIKAKAYVDRGVSAADYYLAQTVKNAEFADGDGDGKVSREEYRKVLTEAQYDQMIQTLLFGLK